MDRPTYLRQIHVPKMRGSRTGNIWPYSNALLNGSSFGVAFNRNVVIIENTMRGPFEVVVLSAPD
jgi:hypothetical protein